MPDETVNTVQLQHWMERIRQGDAEARNELVKSVCRRLEILAHQLLGQYPRVRRWADTGDVLQGSLMRLLRALDEVQINSLADFLGLATTQIRRELIDLARACNGPIARKQRELEHDLSPRMNRATWIDGPRSMKPWKSCRSANGRRSA